MAFVVRLVYPDGRMAYADALAVAGGRTPTPSKDLAARFKTVGAAWLAADAMQASKRHDDCVLEVIAEKVDAGEGDGDDTPKAA